MRFRNSELNDLVQDILNSSDEDVHVIGWNLFHEEQVSHLRLEAYESSIASSKDFGSLNARHGRYVAHAVNVAYSELPSTFRAENRDAHFGTLEGNQWLVRVERLTRAFSTASVIDSFDVLDRVLREAAAGDAGAIGAVDRFLGEWNAVRDGRPHFAAFKDEVEDDYVSAEWPNALRDRLGLGHLDPAPPQTVEVAVFVYKASEALRRKRSLGSICQSAFARPTTVDANLNTFFFPVPRGAESGATLHLGAGKSRILTQEVVHVPFAYRREHLKKIGRITSRWNCGSTLTRARNEHLAALQGGGLAKDWLQHR